VRASEAIWVKQVRRVSKGRHSRGSLSRHRAPTPAIFGRLTVAVTLLMGVAGTVSPQAWAVVVSAKLATAVPGAAVFARPATGVFTVDGRAYGHGLGMSQEGAIGAARLGIGAPAILAHYYPGSVLTNRVDAPLRVWLQRAGQTLTVTATPRLRLIIPGLAPLVMPSGPVAWRLTATATGPLVLTKLSARNGAWTNAAFASGKLLVGPNLALGSAFAPAVLPTLGVALFRGLDGVRVENRDGSTSIEPGSVTVHRQVLSQGYAVVVLTTAMDTYLRAVVGQEIGPGSPPAAQQAQSIAARTYAARSAVDGTSAGRTFDICDTTNCQDFPGIASGTVSAGPAADYPRLYANTDAAIAATKGQILIYGGKPIFATYAAANGGYTRYGGQPYLPAQPDVWDGLTGSQSHGWTASLPTSVLEAAWTGLGSLTRMQVVGRDGHGDLGGRATTVLLDFCTATKCTQISTSPSYIGGLYYWPDNWNGLRSSWWLPRGQISETQPATAGVTATAPSTLSSGQPGTISALVKVAGLPVVGATVTVTVQIVGTSGWTTVGNGATSGSGAVSFKIPGQLKSFNWRLTVAGDGHGRLQTVKSGSILVAGSATVPPVAGGHVPKVPPYRGPYSIGAPDALGVKAIQAGVVSDGFPMTIDGSFGPMTRAGVIRFQLRHALVADGIVGPLTYPKIARPL
jgi:stage II sporulation protein D